MSDNCACVLGGDGDGPDVYSITWPRARKTYFCCECHEPILKGETYEHYRGKWDDRWMTFRTCKVCARIRNHMACGGIDFGELRNAIIDELGTDYITGESWFDEGDDRESP